MTMYPMLEIDLQNLYKNTRVMVDLCSKANIKIAGVVKGFNGIGQVVDKMIEGGCEQIASSRLQHLKETKERNPLSQTLLLRLPMMCEIEDLVRYCDISLNSEEETLLELNKAARRQNKKHNIILMFDLGDLREGVFTYEELLHLSLRIENELKSLNLLGIGTNLSCYGSVNPTVKNLSRLCQVAEKIEKEIGRELEIISGGSTTSLPLLLEGRMPKKINHLRIGDAIINPCDLIEDWKLTIDGLEKDTFILKAQIIEINIKPTYPIGELFLNAFNERVDYVDRGLRKRAILAVGNQDLGDCHKLLPRDKSVRVMGGSSDHLIIDIDDCETPYRLGDIVEFNFLYQGLLFLTSSKYVNKVIL